MSLGLTFQEIKAGEECFELTIVTEIEPNVLRYELVGRVILCEDKRYHIQLTEWIAGGGHKFGPSQDRGYLLMTGALKAFRDRYRRMS